MDGILLVDKPKEWTSFDVVAKVRGILRHAEASKEKHAIKVGHTGTLDPLATGLLIILIGSYTKRTQELAKVDKTYEVTVCLGKTSTTGDEEGEKTTISTTKPALEAITAALEGFTGPIQQVPPKYSAIKVNGTRAYALARAGKEVTMEARQVHIYSITEVRYSYPELCFTTTVSSGTYIRSLVEDIGKTLGCGAYLRDLRRSKVGEFYLKDAVSILNLDAATIYKHLINR